MSAPMPTSLVDEMSCHTADLTTYCDGADVVVTVSGEIDAANAERFASYALDRTSTGQRLTVDLTELEFFGVEAFSALHTVNVRCAADGVRWVLTVGPAAARVLRLCDPAGALPVIRRQCAPASLQLVSESGQSPGQESRHVHL